MNGRLIIAAAAAVVSVTAAAFGTGETADGITLAGVAFACWEVGAFVIERGVEKQREASNV
jgi:hypothetical protein